MTLADRRVEFRPARVDEIGRFRCWRCGAVLCDGHLAPGTSLNLNCKCDGRIRNRLEAPREGAA